MSDAQAVCSISLVLFLIISSFFLKRIGKLYSIDGNDYVHFLGFRLLRTNPFGFSVYIPKRMLRRSYTDQFILVIPEDILGSSYETFLIIITKEGRYSTAFNKLSQFTLPIEEWNI